MPSNSAPDPALTPLDLDKPVTLRDLPAAIYTALGLLFQEREAWGRFGADVIAFHKEHGIAEEFEAYQKERRGERKTRAKKRR